MYLNNTPTALTYKLGVALALALGAVNIVAFTLSKPGALPREEKFNARVNARVNKRLLLQKSVAAYYKFTKHCIL